MPVYFFYLYKLHITEPTKFWPGGHPSRTSLIHYQSPRSQPLCNLLQFDAFIANVPSVSTFQQCSLNTWVQISQMCFKEKAWLWKLNEAVRWLNHSPFAHEKCAWSCWVLVLVLLGECSSTQQRWLKPRVCIITSSCRDTCNETSCSALPLLSIFGNGASHQDSMFKQWLH